MPVTELRIMDLLRTSEYGAYVAGVAAIVQQVGFDRAGHMLLMTEDRTWRALRKAADIGSMRNVTVECARCGVSGYVWEWYCLVAEGASGYRLLRAVSAVTQHPRLYKMANRCRGDAISSDLCAWIVGAMEAYATQHEHTAGQLDEGNTSHEQATAAHDTDRG
jgi:hypothetical protein